MAIRHILLCKVRREATAEQIASWKQQLEAMKNKVQGVIELRVVPHKPPYRDGYLDRSQGYTYVLDSTFKDVDALLQYTVHPDHRAAQKYGADYIKSDEPNAIACVDFEI